MGTEESVDYRSTVRADPLSIPPDLTQVNQDARYRAPEGTATFSEYAQTEQQRRSVTDADRVLPQQEGIRVMRDGDLRWLVGRVRPSCRAMERERESFARLASISTV